MSCDWISTECKDCGLCEVAHVPCMPKGTESPWIYFVGEAPGPDEDKTGVPFIGRAGRYLHDIVGSFGLNENNCRFFNMVRCFPKQENSFRAPTQEEIDACMKYFLKDIEMTKPKIIVTLGNTPAKALFPDMKGGITKNRGVLKKYGDFYVLPTLHPSYLMRQPSNNRIRLEFKTDIKLAMDLCMNQDKAERIIESQVLRDSESSTVICKSYDQFNEFCLNEIDDASDVAFDVETNAKEVHNIAHRVVGFSIASNKDTGCYVPIDSLDFKMSEEDKKKIENRLREILSSKKVIVYNCQHEYPVTLNWLDLEIGNIDDIFVMVKLMMGNADRYQGNGGLKAQSVMHLGYSDWSEDLDRYFDYLRDYDNNKDNMLNLVKKYYDEDYQDVIKKIEDVVYGDLLCVKTKVLSYGYAPYKLVGRYGSIDSSVLFELRKFYHDWMDRDSETLGINLYQGYKYWMWHHYAGFILERNAAYWNDDYATKVENWCKDNMLASLKGMVASPLSESYIKDKLYNDFLIYLKDEHIEEILGQDYKLVKNYSKAVSVKCNNAFAEEMLARMSIYPDKSSNCKLQLGNINTLARRFLNDHPGLFEKWYSERMKKFVEEDHTIDEYKVLINPTATASEFRDFISQILITPDVRVAKMYTNLVELIEDPSFNINSYKDLYDESTETICNHVKKSYNFDIDEFLRTNVNVRTIDNNDSKLLTLVDLLRKNQDLSPSDRYEKFCKFIASGRKFNSWKINRAINSSMNYKFDSLDAGVMNEIYELYRMLKIDVDDESTWSEEFRWFYNYKMYKKYAKIISTYINGKVGRNNVYYADEKSARENEFTRREALYDGKDHSGKLTFMQQEFSINMADTGRWKSGMHNLPAGDAIKSIYTSRFKGGCVGMPDGSQMEVRTLAAECKDEGLLKAFRDKLDIHKYFASLIYQVPYEKVEKWQRGLAKNAVFGMIYGESEKAFADIYLNGDIERAREVFNGMFNGFPKIKEYIEKAQGQYLKFNKVTTITQRFINLNDPKADSNRMLRQAQNFPIQAAAEDLAGIILYKLCEFLKENNMKSKPFCFIHDSIEIDMHPDEVFKLVDKINWLFNVFPQQEFGVPVACDVPLGPSMGQEIEISDLEHDEDYNDVTFKLEGYIDDIDEQLEIWKEVYDLVESEKIEGEDDSAQYQSLGPAFLPKKAAISMKMGTTRYKGVRKIHVIRKK